MRSIHRETHASGISAVFRKHLAGVFAGEDYIDALSSEQGKVVSKGAPPERVKVPEATRVDKYLARPLTELLQEVNELMSRAAVEMPVQLQMENTIFPANRDLEIGCHPSHPFYPRAGSCDVFAVRCHIEASPQPKAHPGGNPREARWLLSETPSSFTRPGSSTFNDRFFKSL
jgi:hypothetical protein